MTGTDIAVGIAIAIGLVGILIPMLPGSILVLVAIGAWAGEVGTSTAWAFFAGCTLFIGIGVAAKYLVPGRRLKEAGVPNSTLLFAGLLGVIGFFVIPVVGVIVGFVLGIYLAELRRLGAGEAWPATKHALKAVGLSILIELLAAMAAAFLWVIGAIVVGG